MNFFIFYYYYFFLACWVSVYAGARTPELKVTGKIGYHLGQQARWLLNLRCCVHEKEGV